MKKLTIKTKKSNEIIDITDKISSLIKEDSSGCLVFLKHTTAAITTADLDPGTDLDMIDAYNEIIPDLKYRHPHNPEHVPSHILSSLIGTSLYLPINNNAIDLGTWQRVILVELDGPKEREIIVQML